MSSHLRILCFGDSLTEGYTLFGTQFSPYSVAMKKVLDGTLSTKIQVEGAKYKIEVLTDGQSGDLVTIGSFKARMERRCAFLMTYLLL